jgi:aspartokinase-like uncharacterized kinase
MSVESHFIQEVTPPTKVELARKVRKSLEIFAKDNNYPEDLKGLCAIASIVLAKKMIENGYSARLIYGDYTKRGDLSGHCWVVSSKKIYDLTATQFGFSKILVISNKDEILYHYQKNHKISLASDYSKHFNHWVELTKPTSDKIEKVLAIFNRI